MAKERSARKSVGRAGATGVWALQDAKARFSEVFRMARSKGPQRVTRHGREAVVVIPAEQFEHLTARASQPRKLADFFARSPLAGSGVRLVRTRDYGREIEF
jgi:antitoxin Phd